MEGTRCCSKCGEVKLVSLFLKDRNQCKVCKNAYSREYHAANRDKVLAQKKVYTAANVDKERERKKAYHAANRDKINERHKAYRVANRDKIFEREKAYRVANRDKKREYTKNRKMSDPLYRLQCNIRTLIGMSIKNNGYTKKSSTYEILGCSYEEFKEYIEQQFVDGMSWENRSEWHLDHKIPVSYGMDELEITVIFSR
jgi:hypothetical protein